VNLHWIHCIENFSPFSIFEQLSLALKNRVSLKFFTVLTIYFLSFGIFEPLALALKNRFDLKFFTVLKYFYHSGYLSNFVWPEIFHCIEYTFYIQEFWAICACLEKQSAPWIHLLNAYFLSLRIFEQLALALKNRVALKFFTVLKYFLLFRSFEQLVLALKFFKPGAAAPPCQPPCTLMGLWYGGCCLNDNSKMAWISPVPTEWIVLVWFKN